MSYSQSEHKVHGILFDGAWLWEEYLATLLVSKGFTHAVKEEKNGIKFFEEGSGANQRYPDFYSLDRRSVIDAKYKNIDGGMGQREDQFQLIAYMHTLGDKDKDVRGAEFGALVYPSQENKSRKWSLNGCGGTYAIVSIKIPKCIEESYTMFCKEMKNSEEAIIVNLTPISK
jgi:5-methylcytosine-specific restriction endonuclease McrBC regulatory subunit McrC